MEKYSAIYLTTGSILFSFLTPFSVQAQITPDSTLPNNTVVTPQENITQIDGGTIQGSNLFHSFQDFSVSSGTEAFFNNADTISNILSRVTGGNISNIDGSLSANGTANLFLVNPAGIIFGEGASLNVGGSFLGSTADSILFPDGVEFSATNTQAQPILTINAPIGFNFRDNPGTIINRSFDEETFTGLEVPEDKTLALIGGEVFIDGGFLSTPGGRIEVGSVAENNTISLTEVEEGWDIGYEGVENFQDISLTFGALVQSFGENTGDVQVQGRNISLTEGSAISINTNTGQAGNLDIVASESLALEGNGAEVDLGDFSTLIFNNVSSDATGEDSKLTVNTPSLDISNGAQLNAFTFGIGKGVDVEITASDIEVDGTFDNSINFRSGILTQVGDGFEPEDIAGKAGDLIINTDRLTVNNGATVSTVTFSLGDTGDLLLNATESVELIGTVPGTNISSDLAADVGDLVTATGNGGDLTVNTPKLEVRDGAQIGTVAQNEGNGGNLTINASESIFLTGTSSSAEFQGQGRSGIFINSQPSLEGETGEIIRTTGNGGNLSLTTPELIIEQGAVISTDTFSAGDGGNADIDVDRLILRDGGQIGAGALLGVEEIDTARGNGGTLNIDATESVEITGTGDINGDAVNSSLFTIAESNGDAGDITLNTGNLMIADGGNINLSAIATGAAGSLKINATGIDLRDGSIIASTSAGDGGNITLDLAENLTLRDNSLISASASGNADGGNIDIFNSQFIVAFPSSIPGNGSDIIANAEQGDGGNIDITAESLFGIQERTATEDNGTNDIDASSQFGLDGSVSITTPDLNAIQGDRDLPNNLITAEQTTAQACRSDRTSAKRSGLTVKGKGGVPAEPTALLTADSILVNGQTNTQSKEVQYQDITSIPTSIGNITPARGMIKTEDGRVILTAYRTNYSDRSPDSQINCSSN